MAGRPLAIELIEGVSNDPQIELFFSPEQRAYITLPVQGRRETLPIGDAAVERYVTTLLLNLEKPPGKTLLGTIIAGLDALAFTGPCREVYTRIANLDDRVIIDLADDAGQAIICSAEGWKVTAEVPVPFVRPPGMGALPVPQRRADALEMFWLVCAAEMSEAAFMLVLGWLISALLGRPPFPLLLLWGGHGSGKSSTARMLRNLVDPNQAPLRSLLDSERDLAIMADNSSVLAFDNVSLISQETSDVLCRITSGVGGFSTRRLYRNREEELFQLARPVIITSIHDVVVADDLRDRTLPVHVGALSTRLTDTALAEHYDDLRPGVLAALVDGVCAALKPPSGDDHLRELPRLADTALAADAALEALGDGALAFTHALDHLTGVSYR